MPSPLIAALVVFALYVAVVGVVWRVNGVEYDRIAETRRSVVRGIVVPIGLGLVLLVAATSVLGWWGQVLAQPRQGPTWLLVVPAIVALTAIVGAAGIDWRHEGARRLPLLAIGVLLVGAAEELLSRGLLVVAPQRAGWALLGVWLFSSVLFGLLHALNGFFGLGAARAAVQVVLAFLGGTAFFVTLMATGSLVVCALLHAAWDFGTLGQAATGRTPRAVTLALLPVTWVAAIAGVVALLV